MSTMKEQITDIQAKVSGGTPVSTPAALNFDTVFPVLTSAQTAVTGENVGGPLDPLLAPILTDITTRLTDTQAKVTAFGSAPVTGTTTAAQVLTVVADLITKTAALAKTGSTDTNAVTVLTAVQAQVVSAQNQVTAMVTGSGSAGTSDLLTRLVTGVNNLLNQDGLPPV